MMKITNKQLRKNHKKGKLLFESLREIKRLEQLFEIIRENRTLKER